MKEDDEVQRKDGEPRTREVPQPPGPVGRGLRAEGGTARTGRPVELATSDVLLELLRLLACLGNDNLVAVGTGGAKGREGGGGHGPGQAWPEDGQSRPGGGPGLRRRVACNGNPMKRSSSSIESLSWRRALALGNRSRAQASSRSATRSKPRPGGRGRACRKGCPRRCFPRECSSAPRAGPVPSSRASSRYPSARSRNRRSSSLRPVVARATAVMSCAARRPRSRRSNAAT